MVLSQNGPAREYDSSAIPTECTLAEFTSCDPGGTDVVAIPDEVLLANLEADRRTKASLGISGRLNRNENSGKIARFEWKAQVPSHQIFTGEAYHAEQEYRAPGSHKSGTEQAAACSPPSRTVASIRKLEM